MNYDSHIYFRTIKLIKPVTHYAASPKFDAISFYKLIVVFETGLCQEGLPLTEMVATGCPLAHAALPLRRKMYVKDPDIYEKYLDGFNNSLITTDEINPNREAYESFDYDSETQAVIGKITNDSGYTLDDVTTIGYEETLETLKYLEKFRVFVYTNYVTDCATTQGVLQDMKALAHGYNPSRTTKTFYLTKLLETLDLFWD